MSQSLNLPGPFQTADLLAVLFLFVASIGIGWLTEHPPKRHPSVSVLMMAYRREWMRHFITRDPRIFDGNILASLRDATAFFGSACLIAIGGCVALIGNTERLTGLARELDLGNAPALHWELKILTTLFLLVNAFLKFVWSHRLFGYCAIMMASVPDDPANPLAEIRAAQAAELNITAARSFNAGLRNVYFSLGSLAWFLGPWALFAATLAVLFLTWRREFASASRRELLRSPPQ